jgi:hypothetical protein
MHGVEGQQFTIQNIDFQQEVESMVRQAREVLACRLGASGGLRRGVAILVANSYEKQKYQWISNGLKNAQGWSIQSKIKSLIPGQSKSPVLTYTHDSKVLTQATESQVAEWLARRASGDEERDLITDDYCSRGWETDSLMVIVMTPTGEMVELLSTQPNTSLNGWCVL